MCSVGEGVLSWEEEMAIGYAGICLTTEDFNTALDNLQGAHSDTIGAPTVCCKIPGSFILAGSFYNVIYWLSAR